jgi:single-strand DNA-binding protein
MNKVILIGNLTKDVELRNTASGKMVASFGLATNESYKDSNGNKVNKAEFHNITAWGKIAELLAKYCSKGKKISVVGKLQTTDYTGQDGVKRYKTEVIASDVEFLSPADKAENNQPAEREMKEGEDITISEELEEEEIKIENIPF